MTAPLLAIESLHIAIGRGENARTVVRNVSLDLAPGEARGLVGESGSGKSMTAKAITRLLPDGANVQGEITFNGESVLSFDKAQLREYRSRSVSMIYQDPRAYTNPLRTIGDFVTEALRTNQGMSWPAARARAIDLLESVRIDDPERRLQQYPHQLSGGMLQRTMIGAALATEPALLIADEPTTALDVTTQAEVMAIRDEQRRERGLALLFITHDLDLAAAVCDRMSVMYAGTLMETRSASDVYDHPAHPYTRALLDARPSITIRSERLAAIPGRPLSAFEVRGGCAFAGRCSFVEDACRDTDPEIVKINDGWARCRRAGELRNVLSSEKGTADVGS
jgi:oligopeptide/dipeptide ABC transporter ATP-binding protein